MILLNIAIAVSSFAFATLAIAGDTWDKSQPEFSKKLTGKGRIAVALLLLSLGLNIGKDVYAAAEERLADSQKKELRDELEKARRELADIASEQKKPKELTSRWKPKSTQTVTVKSGLGKWTPVRLNPPIAPSDKVKLRVKSGDTWKVWYPGNGSHGPAGPKGAPKAKNDIWGPGFAPGSLIVRYGPHSDKTLQNWKSDGEVVEITGVHLASLEFIANDDLPGQGPYGHRDDRGELEVIIEIEERIQLIESAAEIVSAGPTK